MVDLLRREGKKGTGDRIAVLMADVNELKCEKFCFSELSG
jgi:hypothetical protein